MMYGGRIIILGNSGEKVGEDMTAGEIFVGGEVQSLGSDAKQEEPSADDLKGIREFLDKYGLTFEGTFKKIVNAGTKLHYKNAEPMRRNIPFFKFSGGSDYWNEKVQEDIYIKSQMGRYRIRGYGAARPLPHLTDIAFKRDLSQAGRDPDLLKKVEMRNELRGAEQVGEGGAGHRLTPVRHCREYRRGRHDRSAARGGGSVDLPVSGRAAGLERP
jgi:hypothetical protein